MRMRAKNYKFETLQLHVGQENADPVTDARAVPIYHTTAYVFHDFEDAADRFALKKGGNIYGRLMNPTQDVLEKRMAALEGGVAALAFASGMAAITAVVQALMKQGENIVSATTVYGGTYNFFTHTITQWGMGAKFVEPKDGLAAFEQAIDENTRLLYAETVGNPNADLVDMEGLAEIAHKHNIPLVIDNTFATPYLLRPIEHGADIVLHSASKFISGNGTTLSGIVIDGGTFDWKNSGKFPQLAEPNESYHGVNFSEAAGKAAFAVYLRAIVLRDTGASLAPISAFLLLQSLETLSLRVERHVENALQVTHFLAKHPKVERVNHPAIPDHPDHALYEKYFPNGGISIFTFEIKGGEEAAKKFIDHLKIFSLLANVADLKSLVIHPATTTHGQLDDAALRAAGITRGTIRLSIGTEHIDDILADLEEAFRAI